MNKPISVYIQLELTSQPITYYRNVLNVFEKGSFLCIALMSGEIHKYPTDHIFRIVQDFGYSARAKEHITPLSKD